MTPVSARPARPDLGAVPRARGGAGGRADAGGRRGRLAAHLAFAAALLAASPLAPGGARPARADGPVDALTRALANSKAEVRVEGLERAAKTADALSPEQRRREALLLRKALAAEPDATVRRAVVATLAALKDDAAWVPVVQASLADRDDLVRRAATDAILTGRSDLLAALTKLLHEDQDETFRAEVALLLGRRRRPDAVPALLDALADAHVRVRTAAAEALEAVTGEALGYEAAPWRAWWAARSAVLPPPSRSPDTVTAEPVAPKPPPPPPPPRALVPEVYGLPLPSKDVVFVVDVSGSVGDAGVEAAKGEIVRAVERFGSDVRFAAVFFDAEVRTWHPETIAASPAAKAEFARYLRGLGRGKRTDVMTALNAGLGIVNRRVAAKRDAQERFTDPVTMVVVSDGQENLRATPGNVVGDRLDRLDLSHVVVHAVVVGGKDSGLMAALARRGGGSYRVVP